MLNIENEDIENVGFYEISTKSIKKVKKQTDNSKKLSKCGYLLIN